MKRINKTNKTLTKRTKIGEKIIAIFLNIIIILASVSFSISLSSETVEAVEQKGCCIKTVEGKSCVPGETRSICELSQFKTTITGDCADILECKPGTCVPLDKNKPCMAGIEKTPCTIYYEARWFSQKIDAIGQCQRGCCIIAKGVKAEVLQKRQCEALAEKLGYKPEEAEFNSEITNQGECARAGSPTDISCCVLGGGMCKYETREACQAENGYFTEPGGIGGIYCSVVETCTVTKHAKLGCGIIPGAETDIYWFDSAGNQEDIYKSCNYPHNICTKKNETQAECKNTECKIKGSKGGQIMSSKPPKVNTANIENSTLLTGTSRCYNFYTHFGHDLIAEPGGIRKYSYDETARSIGLQNQILHCNLGKIQIESIGPDRQKLCVDSKQGSVHANVVKNNWQNCIKCGKAGFFDNVGDLFGPFPPLGRHLNNLFGEYCEKGKCEDLGDCVWLEDVKGGWMALAPGATSIGSCSPKYPPGTEENCFDCGKGGDRLWNVCNRGECYAMGNCNFEAYSGLEKSLKVILIAALATYINRIVWVPVECTIYGTVQLLSTGNPGGYLTCLKARSENYFGWATISGKWLGFLKSHWRGVAGIAGATATIIGLMKSLGK